MECTIERSAPAICSGGSWLRNTIEPALPASMSAVANGPTSALSWLTGKYAWLVVGRSAASSLTSLISPTTVTQGTVVASAGPRCRRLPTGSCPGQ